MESHEENYAWKLFDVVKESFNQATQKAKRNGQRPKLECQTDFGLVWITHLTVQEDADLLQMEGLHEDGTRCLILAHPAQCSFKISLFTPSATEEKIVTGFGERKTA